MTEPACEIISIKDCSFKAFRLVLDYIYLDNLNILDEIVGCNELTEILKLAKQYQLPSLLEKCERQFLTLPSLQLFKNLITNSSQIGSFLKRGKEKASSGGRNYTEPSVSNYNESDDSRGTGSDIYTYNSQSSLGMHDLQEVDPSFRRPTYSKKLGKQKNENLDGIMFLADGRVLIVNNDLYQEVMKKGIVIDLNEKKARHELELNIPSAYEEEAKDRFHIHSKAENSRSVTQGKKIKKSSINTSKKIQPPNDEISESSKKRNQCALAKDLIIMLNNKEFSDITICIEGKEIHAHKAVLSARSTYFEAMFSYDFKEADKNKVVLKDVVSFDLFYNLLEFMYSDMTRINVKNVFDMLSLAEEYGVASYKEKCEILLSKYITISTVCLIFRYANEYNCERLKETCLVYMEENYDEVIYSTGFEELDKDEILLIIRLCKDKKAFKVM